MYDAVDGGLLEECIAMGVRYCIPGSYFAVLFLKIVY